MKVAIWDTYVPKPDGTVMHFDIVVPDTVKEPQLIHTFGKAYLESKGHPDLVLSSEECRFCHIEAIPDAMAGTIDTNGFAIIEMENCN